MRVSGCAIFRSAMRYRGGVSIKEMVQQVRCRVGACVVTSHRGDVICGRESRRDVESGGKVKCKCKYLNSVCERRKTLKREVYSLKTCQGLIHMLARKLHRVISKKSKVVNLYLCLVPSEGAVTAISSFLPVPRHRPFASSRTSALLLSSLPPLRTQSVGVIQDVRLGSPSHLKLSKSLTGRTCPCRVPH